MPSNNLQLSQYLDKDRDWETEMGWKFMTFYAESSTEEELSRVRKAFELQSIEAGMMILHCSFRMWHHAVYFHYFEYRDIID